MFFKTIIRQIMILGQYLWCFIMNIVEYRIWYFIILLVKKITIGLDEL